MTITTKRFLLRDFTKDDASAFIAYHADPRSLAHYGPEEAPPGHAKSLLRTFALWSSERPRRNFQLAVVQLKEPHLLVGCSGLRRTNPEDLRAEFGIELAPEYWGRHGFAIEVAHAMIEFGFSKLGLREIFGSAASDNTRVKRLATWFGATEVVGDSGSARVEVRGCDKTEWQITYESWKENARGRSRAVGNSKLPRG
jgi:[ribosomal protein S5]-alanine N-acetyltransferase